MIRMTLRQFRTEALISFSLLAVLAIVLAVTGPHLAHVYGAFESTCKAARDCAAAPNPVLNVDKTLQGFLPFIVTIAPALIGLFFGAPIIARELESGTFRLAWTQSVTRRRWLAVKLGLVGIAAMALGGLLTWIVDWWLSPLDAVSQNRFDPANFGFHGVAAIGYAAFSFALGATAGALLRRTVPAMAATLLGFVVARLAVEYRIRPYLASPLHESLSLLRTGFGNVAASASTNSSSLIPPSMTIPNDWVVSTAVVNGSGNALTGKYFFHACPGYSQPPNPANIQSVHAACINKLLSATFRTVVTYQPGSRFWPFQWAEMGIFLAAALALCGLTDWWLRRRYA